MINRWSRIALVAGLVVAAAGPLAAWFVDAAFGRDVIMLSQRFDEGMVMMNRVEHADGFIESVPEIYGVPTNEVIRVVFADEADLIVPEEDPSLTLLDRAGGNPLQARTVWYFSWFVLAGGLLLAAAGGGTLLVRLFLLRR